MKGWEENFLREGIRTDVMEGIGRSVSLGERDKRRVKKRNASRERKEKGEKRNEPRTHWPGDHLILVCTSNLTTSPSRTVIFASPRPHRR